MSVEAPGKGSLASEVVGSLARQLAQRPPPPAHCSRRRCRSTQPTSRRSSIRRHAHARASARSRASATKATRSRVTRSITSSTATDLRRSYSSWGERAHAVRRLPCLPSLTGLDFIYPVVGHRLNASSFAWADQVAHLARDPRYSLLVFDNRGVGNSGTPRGPYTSVAASLLRAVSVTSVRRAGRAGWPRTPSRCSTTSAGRSPGSCMSSARRLGA